MRDCIPATGDCGINIKICGTSYIFFFTANCSNKIRESGLYNIIAHMDDLKDIFPEEYFTMS